MLPLRPQHEFLELRSDRPHFRRPVAPLYSTPARIVLAALVVLGLPAAAILGAAAMGFGIHKMPQLSSWIMGGLTLAATLLFSLALQDCARTKRLDWFWLFITGSASLFWGSVFYQSLQ